MLFSEWGFELVLTEAAFIENILLKEVYICAIYATCEADLKEGMTMHFA
ncbi:hypothetical protein EV129_118110 [Rhizobium azibense]|uniref:Uncharacterized protein n=1 Tax=Rhizobium azibense TaxID=1136135 RepID=A0A4R3RBU9_9HYPH|nr:hypothetical protein EV129_118110 [Rhizobium azibense]